MRIRTFKTQNVTTVSAVVSPLTCHNMCDAVGACVGLHGKGNNELKILFSICFNLFKNSAQKLLLSMLYTINNLLLINNKLQKLFPCTNLQKEIQQKTHL